MTVEITYDQALLGLKRAVMEKGSSYVYERPLTNDSTLAECAYFHGDEPGCIVGHVFSYYGVTGDDLGDLNVAMGVDCISTAGIVKMNDMTHVLLESAQVLQDAGNPWGRVVEHAIDHVAQRYAEDAG